MNAVEQLIKDAYRDMDPHTGMFPAEWCCQGCGTPLNADGNHPAELYAGTFTGLCYLCTNKPYFVESTDALDGAQRLNYPPHCPSWRREREHIFAYADCPDCVPDTEHSWRNHPGFKSRGWTTWTPCPTCHDRYYNHPYRVWLAKWQGIIPRAAQDAYQLHLAKATGLKKRTLKKVMEPAKLAIHDSEDGLKMRAEIMLRYKAAFAQLDTIAAAKLARLIGG